MATENLIQSSSHLHSLLVKNHSGPPRHSHAAELAYRNVVADTTRLNIILATATMSRAVVIVSMKRTLKICKIQSLIGDFNSTHNQDSRHL